MMKRTVSKTLRWTLSMLFGTLAASSCAADLRDAVTAGAMGYVTETTTQILSEIIILSDEE